MSVVVVISDLDTRYPGFDISQIDKVVLGYISARLQQCNLSRAVLKSNITRG